MRSTSFVFLAASLVSSAGCLETDPPKQSPAPATIEAFIVPGTDIRSQHAESFEFEGRTIRLTHVEYGQPSDCASGCFYSHVCAVEDPASNVPLLFSADWSSEGEAPLGIATECPTLSSSDPSGSTYSECHPSGLRHPLVPTDEFRRWAESEYGSGPLRWCLSGLGDASYWP